MLLVGLLPHLSEKEIRKMRCKSVDGNSFAFLCDDVDELGRSVQEKLPGVSVIMPLKGFGEHNLQNCRTQDKLEAKVVVAGFSTTCSQKIHNQLTLHGMELLMVHAHRLSIHNSFTYLLLLFNLCKEPQKLVDSKL